MTIKHCCANDGCYIELLTPDWGFTDEAFMGKGGISDIDGAFEANGFLLLLEWKNGKAKLPMGQHIMFKKITERNKITVFVINGDAYHTKCRHIKVYQGGNIIYNKSTNNEIVKAFCKRWEESVRSEDKMSSKQ